MRPYQLAIAGALLAGLGACGYRPPAATNVEAASYKTDLATCRATAASSVDQQNAKRGLTWMASPVRRWGQIGDATSLCMQGKGYGSLRWCTADELKSGARTGTVIVTSAGVQCTDPPASERRRPAT